MLHHPRQFPIYVLEGPGNKRLDGRVAGVRKNLKICVSSREAELFTDRPRTYRMIELLNFEWIPTRL